MEHKQADVSIPLQSSGWGAAAPGPRSDPQPRDYVLWSVFNVLLWCALGGLGCFGFPALVYSIKARDCKLVGDLEGARRHSDRAKVINIVCSVVVAVTLVIFIILTAIFISTFRGI
ncbi:interferon-induced transmembrane protein 5-like [Vidua macroura]|uniref:interferon-induced transmembrane protein 5-like n=1 Tax=Vidua macroura TaxID=187451 RepID=UPI0023A79334|nr:interferon-induced transmembrane protein 5-like [Vidua macroura]